MPVLAEKLYEPSATCGSNNTAFLIEPSPVPRGDHQLHAGSTSEWPTSARSLLAVIVEQQQSADCGSKCGGPTLADEWLGDLSATGGP
jgi:hypothetical protein